MLTCAENGPVGTSLRSAIAAGLPSRVDLSDPTSEAYSRKARSEKPLYDRGVRPQDVLQGSLNDCYAVAAFAAIAQMTPKVIEDAIIDNRDGTFTVMFKKKGPYGVSLPVSVRVDADLYVGPTDVPVYARIGSDQWTAILEKAYAQFVGGYDVLDAYSTRTKHLTAGDVFEAIYGTPATASLIAEDGKTSLLALGVDDLWKRVTAAADAKKPMVFVTFPKENAGARYATSGIHASHNYSVLGYERGPNGERYVILRNPWGQSEPQGDGVDDGIFKMNVENVPRQFLAAVCLR